ncbi:MAG: hypothetical protein ABIL20_07670, partial [candidate division WOR-3 bacterium]
EYDPDEFIKEKGTGHLNDLISNAPDFFTFYKDATKIRTVEDEVTLIKELIEIISKIQDPVRLDRYLKHTSRVFDIPVDLLRKRMGFGSKQTKPEKPTPAMKTSLTNEEKLIVLIFNNLKFFPRAKDIISVDDFEDIRIKNLFEILMKNENLSVQELVDLKIEENLKKTILASLIESEKIAEEDFVQSLSLYKKNIEKKRIKPKISEAIKTGDDESLRKFKEFLRK